MRTDVQKIFTHTPHEKQVMMFTATMDENMRQVCKKFMTKVRGGACARGSFSSPLPCHPPPASQPPHLTPHLQPIRFLVSSRECGIPVRGLQQWQYAADACWVQLSEQKKKGQFACQGLALTVA
jgi:hypothetical protein